MQETWEMIKETPEAVDVAYGWRASTMYHDIQFRARIVNDGVIIFGTYQGQTLKVTQQP